MQKADIVGGLLAKADVWDHLSLLSTAGNSYDADYFGDTSKFSEGMRAQHRIPDGENWDKTIFNVFRKKHGVIKHFWESEMRFAAHAPKQHRASCPLGANNGRTTLQQRGSQLITSSAVSAAMKHVTSAAKLVRAWPSYVDLGLGRGVIIVQS